MSGAGAVVDERLAFALGIPAIDVAHADFELERGGDAVHGLVAIILGRLAVGVEIDEAGRDHQARGVNRAAAGECRIRDSADFALRDAEVAHGIEMRLGIEHAPAADDEVVSLGMGAERESQRQQDTHSGIMQQAMGPLNEEQLPEFLRRHGFRVVQQSPVLLESGKLRVRMIPRDGKSEAQVASMAAPDRWWSMPEIVRALAGEQPGQSADLTAVVALIREEFPELDRLLGSNVLKVLSAVSHRQPQQAPAPITPKPYDAPESGFKRVLAALFWIAVLVGAYLFLRR